MIMPGKNINMSESLIGLGAFVLSILDTPKSIDDCWKHLNEIYIDTGKINKKHTFDNFILTIDLLYIIGSVNINERGEIYNDIK
ncbi:MAG: ABC-three component system middle component 6 [Paraclostridium sp.]|uniref:ABC-three component system middle component 6 n=1 Tax=Paraclostridium sp. TaxID=2023273 RepID=UPI003EE4BFDC